MTRETRTYTITGTPAALDRLEQFFALLHYNAGHSGLFGMPFDGDGQDRLRFDPPPPSKFRRPAQNIAGGGPDLEYVHGDGYMAVNLDKQRGRYYCGPSGTIEKRPPIQKAEEEA